MTERSHTVGRILVVGANHLSSSMTLRDRLFVEDKDVPGFLERLRAAGIEQAIVLSTCDRIEVQALTDDPVSAANAVRAAMAGHAELDPGELEGATYALMREPALAHLFRVPAALASQVIGEPMVLGQVKAGHRLADAAGMVGGDLEAVLQAAYGAAKRVRSETDLGKGPVTIAAVAVRAASDLFGNLATARCLLIGNGDMGLIVAQALRDAGLGHLSVTHPTDGRAQPVARELDCHRGRFADLQDSLAGADVVVSALGRRLPVVTTARVAEALRARRHKPVLLVDCAVPGDIDSAAERLDDAFLYTLADLERLAMQGKNARQASAAEAEQIIDEEVDAFVRGRAERAAVGAVSWLRERFERERQAALAEAGNDAEKATRLLITRLLHAPSVRLRANAADQGPAAAADMEQMVRRLFAETEDQDEAPPS